MIANVVIGTIFFIIIGLAARKSIRSMKNNTCPGCSGGCSEQTRQACAIKQIQK